MFLLCVSKFVDTPEKWIFHMTIIILHIKVIIPYTIHITHKNIPLQCLINLISLTNKHILLLIPQNHLQPPNHHIPPRQPIRTPDNPCSLSLFSNINYNIFLRLLLKLLNWKWFLHVFEQLWIRLWESLLVEAWYAMEILGFMLPAFCDLFDELLLVLNCETVIRIHLFL